MRPRIECSGLETGGTEAKIVDDDFIETLQHSIPLTIRDVVLFASLKREGRNPRHHSQKYS